MTKKIKSPGLSSLTFEFAEIKFTKKELEAIPRSELQFVIASGLAANDLAVFGRLSLMMAQKPSRIELVTQIMAVNHLIMLRHLASKLIEFVRLIKAFQRQCERNQARSQYPELFSAIAPIESHVYYEFARSIRNDMTHHYVAQKILSSLNGYADEHTFSICNNKANGNSLNLLAEEIAFLSRFTKEPGGVDMDVFQKWIVRAGGDLVSAYQKWLAALIRHHFPDKTLRLDRYSIEDRFAGRLTDSIPVLLKIKTGQTGYE